MASLRNYSHFVSDPVGLNTEETAGVKIHMAAQSLMNWLCIEPVSPYPCSSSWRTRMTNASECLEHLGQTYSNHRQKDFQQVSIGHPLNSVSCVQWVSTVYQNHVTNVWLQCNRHMLHLHVIHRHPDNCINLLKCFWNNWTIHCGGKGDWFRAVTLATVWTNPSTIGAGLE